MAKPPIRQLLPIDIPTIEIFDIGAMSEGAERFANLVAENLANVTGFEPNPVELQKLRSANHPRRRYFPHFLGRGGPATFHITRYPGCSSLYEPDPSVIDLFMGMDATQPNANFLVQSTQSVQTTRLDDVPDLPICDYMKLDVQGAELDVLSGATRALSTATVIEVEVEFVPLYKNQPLFGEIQTFLREHNFVLHKLIDVQGRPFRPFNLDGNPLKAISQMLWADAIFVRDFSRLDHYADEQLLKASFVLSDAYDSYDLAFHLVSEYDRRLGENLAIHFAQTIAATRDLPMMYLNQTWPKT